MSELIERLLHIADQATNMNVEAACRAACLALAEKDKRIATLENLTTECKGFDCCPLASKLNEADKRIATLEKAAEKYKDIAEFWINKVDTRHMCEQDYKNWLVLGHKAIHAVGGVG